MSDPIYIFSSQDSENVSSGPFSDHLPSSPPAMTHSHSRKLKKPPPITPKRFSKFFTPRSTFTAGSKSRSNGRAARQLRDITHNSVVNRKRPESGKTSYKSVLFADITEAFTENIQTPKCSLKRKREGLPTPESSPLQPSPSKRSRVYSMVDIMSDTIEEDVELEIDLPEITIDEPFPIPIRRSKNRGTGGRLLERSFGGFRALGRGRIYDHCTDGVGQAADFWSGPEDRHSFQHGVIPFCTASCNTNTLVAFGDEEGGIRLVETKKDDTVSFTSSYISLRPHSNAVMDLAFSSDDFLLATASGDQTARIIDMRTQQTTHVLSGHTASVKQVRFQPGNEHVLATCSRDGSIQLWDMRCRGSNSILQEPRASFQSSPPAWSEDTVSHKVTHASMYNSIYGAHAERQSIVKTHPAGLELSTKDSSSRLSLSTSRLDVSVTALEFLSSSRSHLLMTASEASTSIRLWDIRGRYSRRGAAVPVSATRQPESHSRHRHFGVNSLALTTDRSRFFALSKDNTVYAYSTSHLILGHAPELSSTAPRSQRYGGEGKEGQGPIYGFRHKQFHAVSFYVKAALRPAKGEQTELLAVGSADQCAILFPTDESLLRKQCTINPRNESPVRPCLTRTPSGLSARMNDTIPIYEQHGTPLVRGHNKEVTSLAWTTDGDLVTASDDYTARVWRQGPEARELRMCGEGEGRRWGCAWADVPAESDDE